jgi:hypothetical protein
MMLECIDGVADKTFCIREEMVKKDDGLYQWNDKTLNVFK